MFSDYTKRKIVIVSCIDNLVKGAAGQAIQNMNIMFDFEEIGVFNLVKKILKYKDKSPKIKDSVFLADGTINWRRQNRGSIECLV